MTKVGSIIPKTTPELLQTLRVLDENRRFLIERGVKTAADTFGKTFLDHAYENYNPQTIKHLRADGEKTAAEIYGATWLDIVNEKINDCLMQLFDINKPKKDEHISDPKDIQFLATLRCRNMLRNNGFKTAADLYGETGIDFAMRTGAYGYADGLRRKGVKTAAEIHGATVMDLVNAETDKHSTEVLLKGI